MALVCVSAFTPALTHGVELPQHPAPYFRFTADGFRIAHPRADTIGFPASAVGPSIEYEKLGTQIWAWRDKPLNPSKLRIHRFGEGFDLYFSEGIALRIGSLSAPYISWDEGSVGENIVAPEASYALLSFRDDQPPIVLGFPENKTSLKITGRPGQWVLRSGTNFAGWVRVVAPLRDQPRATADASALGKLVTDLQFDLPRWTLAAPNFVEVQATRVEGGLLATWIFDAPNAILAPPLEAGFDATDLRPLIPKSPIGKTNATGIRWSKEANLTVLFPQSRWWPGRALATRAVPFHRVDRNSPTDIVRLAMENHVSGREIELRKYALKLLNEFAQRIGPKFDLNIPRMSPQLVAAYAVLGQVVDPNQRGPWIEELGEQVGSWSWGLPISDPGASRSTAAIASLALALDDNPVSQMKGAMLDLSLALAERDRSQPTMRMLRDQLFGGAAGPLSEPARILTLQAVTASAKGGQLTLSPVALGPGQEMRLCLPKSAGPLQGGFMQADRQWTTAHEWVRRAETSGPVEVRAMFGPVTSVAPGPGVVEPIP